MIGNFVGGPLDGVSREVDIAFQIIEIFWVEGMDPATVPFFQVAIDTQEVWQYHLVESDYDTYADYEGTRIGADNVVDVPPDVWTAAGRHFDVLNEYDDAIIEVEIDGDSIHFPGFDITVRLAQRQGE